MSHPTADHPALALLADTLRATSGPPEPETIAKLLGHAIEATGYQLVQKADVRDHELVERLAAAAFNSDTRRGHHAGGPWTWETIGERGRQNYRCLATDVLHELDRAGNGTAAS